MKLEKSRYQVSELAQMLAQTGVCSFSAARVRIYRAIGSGQIVAHNVLGCLTIDKETAERAINGERL